MKIKINGKLSEINAGCSVNQILQEKAIDPAHVVVEINKNIIIKENFPDTVLKQNDTVEIIRFVGGG